MTGHPHSATPAAAMVLAAGIGKRMLPLTSDRPKPLVEVLGKPLVDHSLERLAEAGVGRAVVNLHHFADKLEAHLAHRRNPKIVFSDERRELLDTGGGIAKALPLLGAAPFFLVNSDSLWLESGASNLTRLARRFDPETMDALLLLVKPANAVGYDGRGDYFMAADGRLRRREALETVSLIYAGGAILSPDLFKNAPSGAFPLLRLFNEAEAKERLFGLELDGLFLHVGTPAAIAGAEAAIRRAGR